MVTIIFAHPWHGSFNKAILDTITAKLESQKRDYEVIDLNKDRFNPVFTEKELAVYNRGEKLDPLIYKYQSIISKSDEVVFIFPNWWSGMPAILKGFFDKVLLKDFAFNYEGGFNPLLKINKSTVITTSEKPHAFFNTSIEDGFIKAMLNAIGINNVVWLSCEGTSKGTDEMRKEFLTKIENHIAKN